MTAKPSAIGETTSTWTVRALAGGAIGAGFAFYNFALGSPVQSVGFLSAFDAAGAYVALWAFLWAAYLLAAFAVLTPLDQSSPASRSAATIAFSAAVSILGLVYIAQLRGSSPLTVYVLLGAAILTPLLYRMLAKRLPDAARKMLRPLGLIGAMSIFLVAAGYSWIVNYSPYSFEGQGAIRWAGLALLLACAVPVALHRPRSAWAWIWGAGLIGLGISVFGLIRDSFPEERAVGGSPSGPRKVIVITIDTLRADALSCYRQAGGDTPNIDRLAKDGVLFREVYSPASWTIPSMTSLFTGVTPLVHGVSLGIQDANLPTAADYFKGAGYETVGVFGNPVLTNQRALFPNPQLRAHFDVYHGFRNIRLFSADRFGENVSGKFYATIRGFDLIQGSNTAGLADLAIDRLRSQAEGPLFLWTHFQDPHWPYSPVPEFIPTSPTPQSTIGDAFVTGERVRLGTQTLNHDERMWVRALYQAEVRYVDEAVGRILDELRAEGAYDDALVVLTSDHGEEFWEHGRFGHGHSLHRETVSVPLIFKLPGDSRSLTVATPVENRSLLPTLLELAGIPHEANAAWAPSLVPLLRQTGDYDESAPILTSGVELFENEAAIRIGEWRYIRQLHSGGEQLFNISSDAEERRSSLTQNPDEAQRLRQSLDQELEVAMRLRKAMGLTTQTGQAFDEETLRRLKSLGYL